jgi:hypothetical protein
MGLLAVQAPTAGSRAAVAKVGGRGVPLAPRQAGPGGAIAGLSGLLGTAPQRPAPIRARTVACASWVLAGTTLKWSVSSPVVWHVGDDPGPDAIGATFRLYWTQPSGTGMVRIGCFPPGGAGSTGDPMAGNNVTWQLDSKAAEHGTLARQDFTTDAKGDVHGVYEAVTERTPEKYRTPENEKSTTAGLTVEVTDLFTGFSKTLFKMPSNTATFTVKWYEKPFELEVKLEFVGTRPEFSSIVNAFGKFNLSPVDPPSPSGFQLYEGTGTLTYKYTPIEGTCRLLFIGGGKVNVKALTHTTNPVDPASLAMDLFFEWGSPPTGTNIATACKGGKRATIPIPAQNLMVYFLTALLYPQPPSHIVIDDWKGTGQEPLLAQAVQADTCDHPVRVCNYVGNFYLRPAP